jgi:hypothetical protein
MMTHFVTVGSDRYDATGMCRYSLKPRCLLTYFYPIAAAIHVAAKETF